MIKKIFFTLLSSLLLAGCNKQFRSCYIANAVDTTVHKSIQPPIILENNRDIELFLNSYYINGKEQIIHSKVSLILDDTTYSYESYVLEIDFMLNHYRKNNSYGSDLVEIVNGYPIGNYTVEYEDNNLKSISYKEQNYSGILKVYDLKGNLLYQSRFKEGSGYWKDYYHKEAVLKEEGEVRKNYKYGKWTYYSKTGEIDSTKHYTFQDSVDVRYPYCFFNKTEPCY